MRKILFGSIGRRIAEARHPSWCRQRSEQVWSAADAADAVVIKSGNDCSDTKIFLPPPD